MLAMQQNPSEYERTGTQSYYAGLFREQNFRGKDEDTGIIVYYEKACKYYLQYDEEQDSVSITTIRTDDYIEKLLRNIDCCVKIFV